MDFILKNIKSFTVPVESFEEAVTVEKLLLSIGEKMFEGSSLADCEVVKKRFEKRIKYCIGYLPGGDWWLEERGDLDDCISISELTDAVQNYLGGGGKLCLSGFVL